MPLFSFLLPWLLRRSACVCVVCLQHQCHACSGPRAGWLTGEASKPLMWRKSLLPRIQTRSITCLISLTCLLRLANPKPSSEPKNTNHTPHANNHTNNHTNHTYIQLYVVCLRQMLVCLCVCVSVCVCVCVCACVCVCVCWGYCQCSPRPTALKKDVLQLFKVAQLVLELKAGVSGRAALLLAIASFTRPFPNYVCMEWFPLASSKYLCLHNFTPNTNAPFLFSL